MIDLQNLQEGLRQANRIGNFVAGPDYYFGGCEYNRGELQIHIKPLPGKPGAPHCVYFDFEILNDPNWEAVAQKKMRG